MSQPPSLLLMFVCIIGAEGAPSLRFLQGRVAMLPTQRLSFCTNLVAYAVVVPALCRLRKGRGTLRLVCASEFKSLGHPPYNCSRYFRGRVARPFC